MVESRRIIKVFLASPSDLEAERNAIWNVIREWNETWAENLGYQVELVGWEDTVAVFGRPQQLINQDLDQCGLFVGMMWKKWGTPPDTEGNYTSGFHEEYDRSIRRRQETGQPEISLFFKKVADEYMSDPGQDLIKVLNFKKEIVASKTLMFQEFSKIQEIEALVRKCISQYVNTLRNESSVNTDEEYAKLAKSDEALESPVQSADVSSPLSLEGFRFLQDFVARIQNEEAMTRINACDIARFRLLSNAISELGNHEPHLGVHDINILFSNRSQTNLGLRELGVLTKMGFENIKNENTPLWYWYSKQRDNNIAIFQSAYGESDDARTGAMTVVNWLGIELTATNDIQRRAIIEAWLSEDSPPELRNAAVEYLAKYGQISDLDYMKSEYERSDSSTSRRSLEGMINISLRLLGVEPAAQLVLETPFEAMNPDTLNGALRGFDSLTSDELSIGLKHHNSGVRLRALSLLETRGELVDRMLEGYREDSHPEVRFMALKISQDRGLIFSDSDVRKVLVRPKTGPKIGMLSSIDWKGEEYLARFKLEQLRMLQEAELSEGIAEGLLDADSYFVRVDKYFSNWSRELRVNVDDQFQSYYADIIQRLGALNSETARDVRDGESSFRKQWTRRGLDVLCQNRLAEDLTRIRNNLVSGYTNVSIFDADYLAQWGELEDIQLLVNSATGAVNEGTPAVIRNKELEDAVVRSAYKIGRSDISALFSQNLPSSIQSKVVTLCSVSVFRSITDEILFDLLNSESDAVRKAAAICVVRSFPVSRIKSVLDEYVSATKYRYYNVIHWLDLGASMPRQKAKRVAVSASIYG